MYNVVHHTVRTIRVCCDSIVHHAHKYLQFEPVGRCDVSSALYAWRILTPRVAATVVTAGLIVAAMGFCGLALDGMAAELFSYMAKVKMTHIPYKGGAPALIDVVGGQVPVMFATMVSVAPYVRSGKLRPLGISSAQRSPSLPEVPTIAEAGVTGYESTIWYGIMLPSGVPQSVVNTLSNETLKVLNNPEIRKRFAELGAEATPKTPRQFAEYLRAEIIKWSSVVKNAGIKGE